MLSLHSNRGDFIEQKTKGMKNMWFKNIKYSFITYSYQNSLTNMERRMSSEKYILIF